MRWSNYSFILMGGLMIAGLSGCQANDEATTTTDTSVVAESTNEVENQGTYSNSADGEHAIEVDGKEESYSNIEVNKTGDSEGDEADFYGENAAVFATNGATLTITDATVSSDGTHANGVFSYGEGTTVNISDSTIETTGNCSGGIMTTGGGTMNAENLTIHTTGNSSAAIRSDRGGGTVTVTGGTYTTEGMGSPVVYSTADITVNDSEMTSTSSQGMVVEGKNSVTLNNCNLTADNNTKNSDKSDYYQAVMIYQSMSGDAASGKSAFTMTDGTLTNKNGDIFFVNNTACDINLTNATIVNEDSEGFFLRACAAGWGNEGSNGGKVNLTAANQTINGDIVVDEVSALNLYLTDGSSWTGTINESGQTGDVYVEISGGSTWTLTADAYVSGLTCDADSINLNGHKLYVDGKEYEEGTASSGTAFEIVSESDGSGMPDGENPPEMPDGEQPPQMKDGENPPEMPDGQTPPQMKDGETPPEKPDGNPPSDNNGKTSEKSDNSSSSDSSK
ncbi:MAG: hypothetical protein E7271_10855 [Lachnospiraceae bacterium]|nr:hypothetical protein [Lachnospiraceae bacterium]